MDKLALEFAKWQVLMLTIMLLPGIMGLLVAYFFGYLSDESAKHVVLLEQERDYWDESGHDAEEPLRRERAAGG